MAYTNPSKGVYLNMQRMRAMEKAKEKPAPKRGGLLSSPIKRIKREEETDFSMKRVAHYVDILQQKRQELKDGN